MVTASQSFTALPRCDPDHRQDEAPLATAAWIPSAAVLRAIKAGAVDRHGAPIILGQLWEGDENHLFVADDDRHLVTIAGSRAGKGRGLIIPNLLSYPGSVVCIDPKGENAAVTARYRAEVLGQTVVILDPFAVLAGTPELAPWRGGLNPLEWLDPAHPEVIDDVSMLADAVIVRDQDQDPHWNESARAFLKGVMLYIMDLLPKVDEENADLVHWTLPVVRRMTSTGLPTEDAPNPSIEGLLALMKASPAFDGAVAAAGHFLEQMGDRERGGVLSSLRRHTEFLESPSLASVLERSSFDPSTLGRTPTTVYLVLPEWRLGTHARWLRVVISTLLNALQRSPREPGQAATLMVLDEFAALGHMASIERAAGYIAGFGVKLWVILQDLNQLKGLYQHRWETFLGNAGTLTAFGNVDVTTLEYLSKRLGETEVLRHTIQESEQHGRGESRGGLGHMFGALARGQVSGALLPHDTENEQSGRTRTRQPSLQKTALMTPDELARSFAREEEAVLVYLAGQLPFRLNRIRYDLDRPFKSRAAPSPYHR
jgi:type IV secretion system protein VirD4